MDPQSPTPPAKKNRGCLIALAIVGGIVLLVVVAGGFGVYHFMRSPDGQKIVTALKETTSIATEAMKAPGTAEIRGLGCDQAMVMDMERLKQLAKNLDDKAEPPPEEEGEQQFRRMITCQVGVFSKKEIGCDTIASTYVQATGATPDPFVVVVQSQGSKEPQCSSLYAGDGKLVGPLHAPEQP
jgi:hypothetical protein